MKKTARNTLRASAAALPLLLLATPAFAQDKAPAEETDSEVIVVTAQKREQTLLKIPQSISVVGGDRLEQQHATSFVDYAALVPGLSLQQNNPGETRVVLRGINTGGASPTVAIYIDETPFGSSTGQSNAAILAGDLDTFDVSRVEVLRGPQGTLYGANSLGGVIKYITTAPKLGVFEAEGQAGFETVKGGEEGWSGNAVINVPLGEKIAVRASGYYRETPGFIDTTGIDRKNANNVTTYGGRASVLFQPTETLSLRVTALAQNLRAHSRSAVDADPETLEPLDGLTLTQYLPDKNNVDYRLYTGTLNWESDFATLTSTTSYGTLIQHELTDISYALPGIGDAFYGDVGTPGPRGLTQPARITQKKFTQEVRLASADSETLEWLVGGYYTREKGQIFQRYLPFDQNSGTLIDPTLTLPVGPGGANVTFPDFVLAKLDSLYKEYAGFGSATWHVSPHFDITGGVRYSHNKQTSLQVLDGALLPLTGSPIGPDVVAGKSSENVFTWSVAPRFEINDRVALYARVAKGYRPGGPNVVPPGADDSFPTHFEPDTLISYEAGVRAETADRTFAIDASVYYLDWKNIQVLVTYETNIGQVSADGNGDKARSKGAEVTATLRPTDGLSLVLNGAYNDAKLTDDLPEGNGGFDGDRLPYAPQWTANLTADYEWALSGTAKAYVGGNIRLISDQKADFDNGYQTIYGRRLTIDGYATADLRAGVDFGQFNLSVYAKNITNAYGLTNAGSFGTRPGSAISVSPIRPRTIGVTVGASF